MTHTYKQIATAIKHCKAMRDYGLTFVSEQSMPLKGLFNL
jgi:hypothetical protein